MSAAVAGNLTADRRGRARECVGDLTQRVPSGQPTRNLLALRQRECIWGPFSKRRCEATVQHQNVGNRRPKFSKSANNVGDRLPFTPTLPKFSLLGLCQPNRSGCARRVQEMERVLSSCFTIVEIKHTAKPFTDHGRTASYPTAPVQIPACGTTSRGSSKLLASHSSDNVIALLRNRGICVVSGV